ncbi:putative TRAP dicarboxylate transporter, DctP subunit [Vibrio nigripulchritudo SOn1]|uniref:TRAP dicarboxylate transporter, DctP subunit n=1 Tax=Vibrio nigripulchritudo SOn1 TaxID=1238450 RepID=A0AAV2VZK6_9VIBR|nr:TRAP transporter substrate-binding protein [Vibrio nigripulchritudo]CCO50200.1 putative TRAP dicarboxylate transporter, DctP subunit [Vibrio nigripulchritudo SOn1]
MKIKLAMSVLGLMLIASTASYAETIRFATTLPNADNPETVAMKAFKKYVEFHSNKDLKVQLFQGTVGGDREILESVTQNVFQINANTDAAFTSFYPKVQFFSIPYLFDSPTIALDFMRNSAVMKNLAEDMEKTTNLKIIDYAYDGFRSFVNNKREIKTPEDMKGLKIRSMESPVMMKMISSLGAAPTPVPFPESAMAIRQGVVDGGENPPPTIINGGWADVIKYMSLDEHIFSGLFVVVNKNWFNSLSENNKKIVKDGLALYSSIMISGKGQNYLNDIDKITEKGVKLHITTPQEKAEFREVAQKSVIDYLNEKLGKEFIDDVLKQVEESKSRVYK